MHDAACDTRPSERRHPQTLAALCYSAHRYILPPLGCFVSAETHKRAGYLIGCACQCASLFLLCFEKPKKKGRVMVVSPPPFSPTRAKVRTKNGRNLQAKLVANHIPTSFTRQPHLLRAANQAPISPVVQRFIGHAIEMVTTSPTPVWQSCNYIVRVGANVPGSTLLRLAACCPPRCPYLLRT